MELNGKKKDAENYIKARMHLDHCFIYKLSHETKKSTEINIRKT